MNRFIGHALRWYDKSLHIYGNELDYVYGRIYRDIQRCIYMIVKHSKTTTTSSNYIRNKYTLKNSLNAVIKYFGWQHRIKMTLLYGAGHVYYILHTDCKVKLLAWWLLWYATILIRLIRINKVQAPQWIQDYYYNRLLHMVGLK